jgi:hypothetical protein
MAVASSGAAPLMEHVTRMRGSLNVLRTQSIAAPAWRISACR